ncbi:MAG: CpsD/CapB family tyrosine-protein kinase, partial [Bacteroidales bacterium]|nr:CpsD/CapB family tyrosine-protein kinase [Bacteroidales bacterium]
NCAETQAIMMTSYNPGSGKTFTSLNIATSMALKGKHVMLIDLDIRKATLSKTIGEPRKGITNYLNGQIDYEQVVVHNMLGTEGLDFLPVGVIPPNPAELLLDKRLETLIAEVKQHYDYIFIDCPPVGIVADTSIISRVADRTIFVIRVGVLDRRVLPDIERVYKEQQYPNMSLLINGSKQALGYGYSRYSYGYGRYGYGYGGYGYHEEGDGK